MTKNFLTSVFLLSALVCPSLAWSNSTVILYRLSNTGTDKFFVRASFLYKQQDSLPVNHAYLFEASEEGIVPVRCCIENYASWPDHSLRISLIDKDTTFIRVEIKRDIFGNPGVKLVLVPRETAAGELNAVGNNYMLAKTDDENSFSSGSVKDKTLKKSGTGFLVSHNGYIITSYHVVDNAKSLTIKNLNGDKNSKAEAFLFAKDPHNDLAILKLTDTTAVADSIPFVIKTSNSDLGEKVLVFGYPLTNTMGEDVKLTNGIISSVNGFDGDVNSYQLSAPVQPGNSGGPVFDEKGNLIAVVNAKHLIAENATYCIKSPYLLNMLSNIPGFTPEATTSNLWKLPLTEQAKILQRLVYIIEVR